MAPPNVRRNASVAVAMPRSRGSTAFCTAMVAVGNKGPRPIPSANARASADQKSSRARQSGHAELRRDGEAEAGERHPLVVDEARHIAARDVGADDAAAEQADEARARRRWRPLACRPRNRSADRPRRRRRRTSRRRSPPSLCRRCRLRKCRAGSAVPARAGDARRARRREEARPRSARQHRRRQPGSRQTRQASAPASGRRWSR